MTQLITTSQDDRDTDHGSRDVDGFNSAISPSRNGCPQNHKEQKKYELGATARRSLRQRTTSELQDVIRFFCLNRGCQHARAESYLAFGGLDVTNEAGTPCMTSCSICTRQWHEMFLPVYRSSVILFFEFLMQSGQLPHEIDPKSPVSALLTGSTYWKEALFDRAAGGISRMHVDSLFLSLIASGMIKMTMQNNALQWVIAREYDSTTPNSIIESCLGRPIYTRDDAWVGIHLFNENHLRRRQSDTM